MAKNNRGSSLLMVMFFSCIMSLMVLGVWRNTMHTLEASLAHVEYGQIISSTEGLLHCALELGVENYGTLMQRTQEVSLDFPAWFSQQGRSYKGKVYFNARKKHLEVRATLVYRGKIVCVMRCSLKNAPEGMYVIEAWAIDS